MIGRRLHHPHQNMALNQNESAQLQARPRFLSRAYLEEAVQQHAHVQNRGGTRVIAALVEERAAILHEQSKLAARSGP
jgi:hypothetical protein